MTKVKNARSQFLLRGVSLHKSSHSAPKQTRKKNRKEVHKTLGDLPKEQEHPAYHADKTALYKKRYQKMRKEIQTAQLQRVSKKSKRTTPGKVLEDSSPKIVHVEGARWLKTTVKQQVNQSKKIQKKLIKKKR